MRTGEEDLRKVRVKLTVTVECTLYKCGAEKLIHQRTPQEICEALPRFADLNGSVVSATTSYTA